MQKYDYVNARREDVKKLPTGKGAAKFKRGMKFYTKLNVWVYKLSFGKLMHTAMGGYPICVVGLTGKKSGKHINIPLIHVRHGDSKILVGSQAGLDQNPGWVYSVRANPNVTITADGKTLKYQARQVNDDEKRELWPQMISIYPAYDEYQARTDRNIPVFLCEPC
ncbi:MAG: nitroreductase family deazaflavin-dependent oxidoreductase [Pseudomonadales bacterium]